MPGKGLAIVQYPTNFMDLLFDLTCSPFAINNLSLFFSIFKEVNILMNFCPYNKKESALVFTDKKKQRHRPNIVSLLLGQVNHIGA